MPHEPDHRGLDSQASDPSLASPALEPPAAGVLPSAAALPLAELLKTHLPWVRGWLGARLRGRRRQDIDDLCQEILLKALRGASQLRDPSRFPGWLYRIANNKLRDYLRQARRRRDTAALETEPPDPRSTAPDLSGAEELDRLLQAVLSLDEKYREPMILRHVDDLSYSEIARILGISENNVQVRIFRGRQMLKARIGRGQGTERRPRVGVAFEGMGVW